ncbi:MAG: aromatic acid exporter family protein [Proteocatella sp.]
MQNINLKIGMRNIKTVVAVFIDLLIFQILGIENPFYACIASVLCMQQTVEDTLKAGKHRIIGTSLAAVVGLIVYYFCEHISGPKSYIILIPLGVMFLIKLCVVLEVSSSTAICCIVFISIQTTHRIYGDNNIYPLSRIFETFIGIAVATLVNKYMNFNRPSE